MRVFLTGGTGFVGQELLKQLRGAGHNVSCLVREGPAAVLADLAGLKKLTGDIADPASLRGKLDGIDAVINLVGIIREFPSRGITFERIHYEGSKNVIDEALRAGVKQFLQMSALGTRYGAKARYHQTKYMAEQYLKQSGLEYSIFRPAVIFGPADKSINLMAKIIKTSPVFPVIGNGRNSWQPVALENVAQGFVAALNNPKARNKTYEVAGTKAMEYNQVIDVIAEVLGKKILKIHQPVYLVKPIVGIMQRFSFFPLTLDQLIMFQEDNVCDAGPFFREFGISPIEFREGISRYMT
jgi:uncharacterized protein YbjT (DUF2867 family)